MTCAGIVMMQKGRSVTVTANEQSCVTEKRETGPPRNVKSGIEWIGNSGKNVLITFALTKKWLAWVTGA